MKFILLVISIVSMLCAFGTYVGVALTWNYYPSQGINGLIYQYNSLLVALHVGIGLLSLCCWPNYDNRKLMIGIVLAFLGSLILNLVASEIQIEKETTVTIDNTAYQVSSFEMPIINSSPPFGHSPFRMPAKFKNEEALISSLHFAPKQQFDFEIIFKNESAEKFFVVVYASHAKELDEYVKPKTATPIKQNQYVFDIYPEEAFETADSRQKFETFIEKNLPMIERDITARTVIASNAP